MPNMFGGSNDDGVYDAGRYPEPRLSPLSSSWQERHADECDYILVSPVAVMTHAKSVDELLDDYMRHVKPYLKLEAYRKVDFEQFQDNPGKGPWVVIRGLQQIIMRADSVEDTKEWLMVFGQASKVKLRLYEAIDISAQVQAIYDKRASEAAKKSKHDAERKRAEHNK